MSHDSENHLEKDLTLMLLYLTSWEEKEYGETYRRSWKGYDFDLLNELGDEKLISGSNKSKSVYLSEKGVEAAKRLLKNYGMSGQEDR
ncbi:DUF6429 family protein [Sporolactobacillus sp. STSJ-5]|uniref:DUF6429 family protein n=1 Tax=Sporolactobacillus sp. STSJ-5 TaxID=2965076 RepID=UPI002107C220|nr:DUF6429 family protein [Sporolactobacillus sp. STSJ-5]MCQ2009641.1 DUF6429 family protein [Sporolactobacillus sp. STSJ-5]